MDYFMEMHSICMEADVGSNQLLSKLRQIATKIQNDYRSQVFNKLGNLKSVVTFFTPTFDNIGNIALLEVNFYDACDDIDYDDEEEAEHQMDEIEQKLMPREFTKKMREYATKIVPNIKIRWLGDEQYELVISC